MITGALGVGALIGIAVVIYYAVATVGDRLGDRVFGKAARRRR